MLTGMTSIVCSGFQMYSALGHNRFIQILEPEVSRLVFFYYNSQNSQLEGAGFTANLPGISSSIQNQQCWEEIQYMVS